MATGGERGHGENWGSGKGCGRYSKMEVFGALQQPPIGIITEGHLPQAP